MLLRRTKAEGSGRRHDRSRLLQVESDIHSLTTQMRSFEEDSHSIGFSGGQLPSYVEGSSALDFPLRHVTRSQNQP